MTLYYGHILPMSLFPHAQKERREEEQEGNRGDKCLAWKNNNPMCALFSSKCGVREKRDGMEARGSTLHLSHLAPETGKLNRTLSLARSRE